MAQRLTKLRVEEISGVDEPANEAPGWIVAKAKELKTDIEGIEKSVIGLHELLDSDEVGLYFGDAPEEVTKAREVLAEHIAEDLEDDGEQDEVKTGVVAKLRDIFGVEKTSDVQPVVGPPGDTIQAVHEEREPTPAEVSSTGAEADPETDGTAADGSGGNWGTMDRGEPAEDAKGSDAGKNWGTIAKGDEEPEPDPEVKAEAEAGPSEDVAKALGDVIREELDPIRQSMDAVIDRIENLEKASARRTGFDGQDNGYDEEGFEDDSLTIAFRKAARGQQVVLR